MKYLRKFATEAEIADVEKPAVVLINDTYGVKYYPKPKNGVYIQHIDGNLYSYDDWAEKGFAKNESNGVAVIHSKCSFVVAKSYISTKAWMSPSSLIEGVITSSDSAIALTDYDGVGNTAKIVAVSTSGAANSCSEFTFPNGKKGYLPSLGELKVANGNIAEINSAMSLIGGSRLAYVTYWSSTQSSGGQAWAWGLKATGTAAQNAKSFTLRSVPFTTL